jgi:predicted secreted hydrolase
VNAYLTRIPSCFVAIALLLTGCSAAPEAAVSSRVSVPDASTNIVGYTRALAPVDFAWPSDHAAHDDFLLEWWYYTGNVSDAAGRPFGYQLTIFRRALKAPVTLTNTANSTFAFNQIYSAHFAISDIQDKKHHAFERFSRGAAGLAGTQAAPFRVWIEDWAMTQQVFDEPDAAQSAPGNVRLQARHEGFALDLQLRTQKPMVLQADRGYSPKGKNPGNASFYYSFTRMQTDGTLTVAGTPHKVSGSSWMDHEWSTSFLDEDAAGWEWLAIQLSDKHDVLAMRIYNKDGGIGILKLATLIDAAGLPRVYEGDSVVFEPLGEWKSPTTGRAYRTRWRIGIPAEQLELTVEPRFDEQEAKLSTTYYEGATAIRGTRAGAPVDGVGYLEITNLGVDEAQ